MSLPYYLKKATGEIPVSLKQAKSYLKLPLEVDADDDFLTLAIEAASDFAEGYVRRELRANEWELYLDAFEDRIGIRRHPIATIDEVAYMASGSFTVVSSSVYYLKPATQAYEILLNDDEEWPDEDLIDDREHVVKITFTTEAHPKLPQIKLGILRHVAWLYENRGDCDVKSADAAELSGATHLYDQIRVSRV